MVGQFDWRDFILSELILDAAEFSPVESAGMRTHLRIVLPGGNGQVGNILARHFHAQGHDVVVLARRVTLTPWRVVNWDGATLGNWTSELENADVLINLAGRSVDCRYTPANLPSSARLVDERKYRDDLPSCS